MNSAKKSAAKTGPPEAGKPARILVVEDDAATRDVVSLALSRAGHVVKGAPSAEEGLPMLRRESFDLVILDIGLPGMSGLDACSRIKSDPATSRTPVIMLTVEGRWDSKVRGLDAGADDYVIKPARPAELLARVQAVLRRFGKESAGMG